MKNNNITIPNLCKFSSHFLLILILKISKSTKIILPPSSAGIGSKFKTPIFIERITAKLAIEVQPNFDTSPTTLSIPTGPLISFKFAFPEKSVKSPPTVSFKIDTKEFFAKTRLSVKERFVFLDFGDIPRTTLLFSSSFVNFKTNFCSFPSLSIKAEISFLSKASFVTSGISAHKVIFLPSSS